MDGGGDPERDQALESYKNKLLESREWEAKLKALRLEIKTLQKDFDTTEENIKALQSVGQIIGEVLKQLDDERCMWYPGRHVSDGVSLTKHPSHRESLLRPKICCRMPVQGRQSKAETRNPCRSRHDHPDHHANVASRSRSLGVQHVSRRPGTD
jgi:hypothetical protein